jgi:hypothetical protein
MKSFGNAYKNSKETINTQRASIVDTQHRQIVEAVKQMYGVHTFSNLSDSERLSIKSMILEMWNPTNGLTKSGKEFLNEGRVVLTPQSTEDNIKKFFVKSAITHIVSAINSEISYDELGAEIRAIKSSIESMIEGKCKISDLKKWVCEIACDNVVKKIKTMKL